MCVNECDVGVKMCDGHSCTEKEMDVNAYEVVTLHRPLCPKQFPVN